MLEELKQGSKSGTFGQQAGQKTDKRVVTRFKDVFCMLQR